ncbi:hypothetical protein [Pseudoxanthomonas putridarboris]|uniref:Uncharacterized protein n=1 Tax=Pseudoxanthomonas putridarboris TaxID=752605 RepID=A0ABU9IW45_9GAMM
MRPSSVLSLAVALPLLLAALPPAHAQAPMRYLHLVNRAHDRLVSVAVAAPGSQDFRPLPLGEPLPGGGGSATVEIAGDACRYDVRFVFRNGRGMLYPDVDVCRHDRLTVRPLPRRDRTDAERALVDAADPS